MPSLRAFFRRYLRDRVKRSFFSSVSYYTGSRRKDGEARVNSGWFGREDVEKGEGTDRSESTKGMIGGDAGGGGGHQEQKDGDCIRTAEEYEAYVLRPLSRHKSLNRGSAAVDVADGTAVLTPFPAFEAALFEDSKPRT